MAGDASRENGKKGGRPRGTASIVAQEFREKLAEKIRQDVEKWLAALEPKALGGDVYAWNAVMDRAFGKPQQAIDHTTDGKQLPTPILAYVSNNNSNSQDNENGSED